MKCMRCGRPLKNPKSVERGYGIVCAQKLGLIIKNKRLKKKKVFIKSKDLLLWED